ncbi:MAG: hypothetical protein LLG04_17030 [Parachlamydia sp.]|nr:hypothetical protein [Parachlamydia sp.]
MMAAARVSRVPNYSCHHAKVRQSPSRTSHIRVGDVSRKPFREMASQVKLSKRSHLTRSAPSTLPLPGEIGAENIEGRLRQLQQTGSLAFFTHADVEQSHKATKSRHKLDIRLTLMVVNELKALRLGVEDLQREIGEIKQKIQSTK